MNARVDKRAVDAIKRAADKATLSKRLGKDETDPEVLELLKAFKVKKAGGEEEE